MENISDLIGPVITVAITAVVGWLAVQYGALKARIEASPSQLDDKLIELAEKIAGKIVSAKQEDPAAPLGSGPAGPAA